MVLQRLHFHRFRRFGRPHRSRCVNFNLFFLQLEPSGFRSSTHRHSDRDFHLGRCWRLERAGYWSGRRINHFGRRGDEGEDERGFGGRYDCRDTAGSIGALVVPSSLPSFLLLQARAAPISHPSFSRSILPSLHSPTSSNRLYYPSLRICNPSPLSFRLSLTRTLF